MCKSLAVLAHSHFPAYSDACAASSFLASCNLGIRLPSQRGCTSSANLRYCAAAVGAAVGLRDGAAVGGALGCAVVGVAVGGSVGKAVGESVGLKMKMHYKCTHSRSPDAPSTLALPCDVAADHTAARTSAWSEPQ